MEKIFNIPWSDSVKIISVVTTLVLAFVIVVIVYLLKNQGFSSNKLTLLILFAVLGISVYFAFQSPISLKLNEDYIAVRKMFGEVKISYTDIVSIDKYDNYGSDIRLMGNGGFLGYTGVFRNEVLGKYIAYVGNFKQAFYIKTRNNKLYVLSCENREEVIGWVRKYMSE